LKLSAAAAAAGLQAIFVLVAGWLVVEVVVLMQKLVTQHLPQEQLFPIL
jgi:hypothetical protein